MKYTLIFIFTTLLFSSWGQSEYHADNYNNIEVNKLDSLGRKQGPWILKGVNCKDYYDGFINKTIKFDSTDICRCFIFKNGELNTEIKYHEFGVPRMVEHYGDLRQERSSKSLSYLTGFYYSGNVRMKKYDDTKGFSHSIGFADSTVECTITGNNSYHSTYEFKDCEMVKKTSQKTRIGHSMEMPTISSAPYTVEEGTFENYILDFGTIKYYSSTNELISTVEVKNGRRINDPIVYFKDKELEKQVLLNAYVIDLNHNGNIEVSEASVVERLSIDGKAITDLTGFSYFKNIKRLTVNDLVLFPAEYPTSKELLKAILKTAHRSIPPVPNPPWPPEPEPYIEHEEILSFPDVEPSFPGGQVKMLEWIDEHLVYPKSATDMSIQGKVYVSFVVEIDGSLTQIKVIRGVDKDLDREAKRIIRTMPNWIPAQVQGRNVRSVFRLPIKFTLK